ncbi:MAG: hypothetical protein CVV51_02770 [Spirochaetae bacterium HGW-Spirochaetae-7]|jgi:hypothetical protein|nr:MAG: hypothetical protein CVV51_02770 [Spirochaetae bacterium HGW-Spirochaetae-7]
MLAAAVLPDRPAKAKAVPAKARLNLVPGPAAFDSFDGFIRSLPFLSADEACALIVSGDEIIDNLLTHGEVGPGGLTVLVRKRESGLTLGFFVQSHPEFSAFASCLDEEPPGGPHFDEGERRWRGIGLTMCRNIVSAICYRPGSTFDRVLLTFGPVVSPGRSAP